MAGLIGCEPIPPAEIGPEFDAQAIAFLNELQPRSIQEKREYCGYFGTTSNGEFRASKPAPGEVDGCLIPDWPSGFAVIASYHTHGAFDTELDSEVPSTDDLRADIKAEVYGYISTPGGRVWIVDWRDRSASQLCGPGCVFQDPQFIPGDAGPIAQSYTLSDLRRRER